MLDKKDRTVIFVKLWKNKPWSATDERIFSYVIKVVPERSKGASGLRPLHFEIESAEFHRLFKILPTAKPYAQSS